MRDAIGRILRRIFSGEPSPVEWLLAWVLFVFGMMLAHPFDTFAAAAAYGVLGRLVDESLLGSGLALTGLVGLVASWRGRKSERRMAAMVEFVAYLFLAVVIALSVPLSMGIIFFVHAGFAGWTFLRLGGIRNG